MREVDNAAAPPEVLQGPGGEDPPRRGRYQFPMATLSRSKISRAKISIFQNNQAIAVSRDRRPTSGITFQPWYRPCTNSRDEISERRQSCGIGGAFRRSGREMGLSRDCRSPIAVRLDAVMAQAVYLIHVSRLMVDLKKKILRGFDLEVG
jgi:hypothetical protein